jgi:hypothetical protein
MRRVTIATLVALVALTASAAAQTRTEETVTTTDSTGKEVTSKVVRVGTSEDITARSNMIVVNPLKMFLFYNLSYYHALSKSIVVGGGLQMPTVSGISGFGANAEMRWHPSGKAMRGFYVAPNISFNTLSTKETFFDGSTLESSATPISLGVLTGWQWFPGDEFAIGLGLGIDYYWISADATDGETSVFGSYDGLAPALRFDIGYAW